MHATPTDGIEAATRRTGHVLALVPAVLLTVLLAGCASESMEDLRVYTEQVLARKADPPPPLPPVEPYVHYVYKGEGADPFEPFFEEEPEEIAEEDDDSQFAPIPGRIKEELEQYPLDSLRMVGTLEQSEKTWGLVVNRAGTLYRIEVGNYMGQNHGKVTAILEDRIELEERVRDSRGKWYLREATLALVE